MKSSRVIILTLSVALSLLWTNPASAAKKGRVKPTPVPEKIEAGTKIESVGGETISVKSGKTTQTYKIDGRTAISINGKKGAAADLKPGMHVQVDASKITPDLAASIAATSAGN